MVRASVAALNSRNELAFLSAIAEDAVLDELITPQPVEGKRNVKAWFEAWTGAVPDARFEINTILGIGDFVLTETVLRGTLKGPLGGLSASNRGFVVHRAMIAQVKNETFARISAFMNGKELAEAVGQWPPPIVK